MEMAPPPPWVEGLPQDERGFYVLAEAGYLSGKPTFSRNDMDRTVALAINRACALCGFEMAEGHRVYRTFSQGDAADIRIEQSDHTHDTAGPLHLSCALYSSIVCPYLRERTSRLGKASRVNPGGRRGTLAAHGIRELWPDGSRATQPKPWSATAELHDRVPNTPRRHPLPGRRRAIAKLKAWRKQQVAERLAAGDR